MPVSFKVVIFDQPLRTLLSAIPKSANKALNDGCRQVAWRFGHFFTTFRLSGRPGIKLHRTGKVGGYSTVKIPAQMKRAGFRAVIKGQQVRDGFKQLWIGTRSPVMHAHEFGAVINPVNSQYLKVRIKNVIMAKAFGKRVGDFVLMRQVKIPPRLEFFGSWERFSPNIPSIMSEPIIKMVAMVNAGVLHRW